MQPGHIPGTEKDYGGPKMKLSIPGKANLLYAVRNPDTGIDVGDGGYRVRGATASPKD